MRHHYQGQCTYYYVKSCDETDDAHTLVPFEISAKHKQCTDYMVGGSCIDEVYFLIYGDSNDVIANIVLYRNLTAFDFVTNMTLESDAVYYYNDGDGWYGMYSDGAYLEFSLFTGKAEVPQSLTDVVLRMAPLMGENLWVSIKITGMYFLFVVGFLDDGQSLKMYFLCSYVLYAHVFRMLGEFSLRFMWNV